MLLVGPDGTGKSTLARGLIERASSDFSETLHIHWRPRVLPHIGAIITGNPGDPSEPHSREPRGALVSVALLGYHWLDFFLGSWLRIVPMRKRGGLVVMERGWPDVGVDPRRYRLTVSPNLVSFMGRSLPAPDRVFILRSDPQTLRQRKAELPVDELARQLRCWDEMQFPGDTTRTILDSSSDPHDLISEAIRSLGVA